MLADSGRLVDFVGRIPTSLMVALVAAAATMYFLKGGSRPSKWKN